MRRSLTSNTKPLNTYSKFVALTAFFVIVAGGLVTSTGSGLSVPDWPLSYGRFFPPMIGGIRFEHSHRVIAGGVGLLSLGLMVWILRREPRTAVRRLGVLAFLAVVAQAILGGLTVLYLLPTSVSVMHACLAQTFFCLIVSIATMTSKEWTESSPEETETAGSLQRLLVATTSFVYLQLILGAIVRHTHGQAVAYHIGLALMIVLHVLLTLLKISRENALHSRLFSHALFLGFLVLAQSALGVGAFIFKLVLKQAPQPRIEEVVFSTAHQSVGALMLAACLVLTLRAYRFFKQKVRHDE